jgi:hypothetical protein
VHIRGDRKKIAVTRKGDSLVGTGSPLGRMKIFGTLVQVLIATELYTLKQLFLHWVNFTSIKK